MERRLPPDFLPQICLFLVFTKVPWGFCRGLFGISGGKVCFLLKNDVFPIQNIIETRYITAPRKWIALGLCPVLPVRDSQVPGFECWQGGLGNPVNPATK